MILGKISANLRKQNWTGLALELMVLIVGIFLGFQLDNWNDQRKDRNIETRYIERLTADTKFNVNEVSARITELSEHSAIILNIIDMLEANSTDEINTTDAKRVFCYWYVRESVKMRTSTYDELIATGNFAIISDEGLREQIQLIHTENKSVKTDVDLVGSALPARAQVIQPFIKWHLNVAPQLNSDGAVSRETCRTDTRSMVGNDDVISALTQLYRGQRIMAAIRNLQLLGLKSILTELENFRAN